jgi:hypothetical protein
MNQQMDATAIAALLCGTIGSLVTVCKFLISQDAFSQDQLLAYLQLTLTTLESEVTEPRTLIPLRNLIAGIRLERPTMTPKRSER